MKYFTKENYREMPWKNGGGITNELYKDENIRLSIATVSKDGPFSIFSGIRRVLLILNGSGCILNLGNRVISLTTQSDPFYFDGETQIYCSLIGESFQDFNVMVNRNWGEAFVTRKQSGEVLCLTESMFIYNTHTEVLHMLDQGETLMIKDPSICIEIRGQLN